MDNPKFDLKRTTLSISGRASEEAAPIDQAKVASRQDLKALETQRKPVSVRSTDIEAILTVIGQRETTGKNRGTDRLDLFKTQLAWIILPAADLRGANLRGASLSNAFLRNAILSETVNLTAVQVQSGADWREARLPEDLQYLKDLPD